MTWIKRQVVMLATNEKAYTELIFRENRLMFQNKKSFKNDRKWSETKHFHLYILSDEEIKEGDWYENNGVIFRADDKFDEGNNPNQNKNNKKIITTTDSSLKIAGNDYDPRSKTGREWIFLPQPSQSFIEVFVEEYNKGNIITEVMVEYENNTPKFIPIDKFNSKDLQDYIKLKINPKDNTITIRKIKDSWNKEELTELFLQCNRDLRLLRMQDIQIWIDKNL